MATLKKAKMADLINYRLRVVTLDHRQLTGELLAFDKYMNLVLADTEEFRLANKTKTEVKRTLGLIILRGETVVSVSVEAPPTNSDAAARFGTIKPGPGTARPVNRGPTLGGPLGPSLAGPVRTSLPGAPPGMAPPPGFAGR